MTRKSRREIERTLDDLEGGGRRSSVADLMWANLKDYYDGALSPDEQRLLDEPETHLTPAASAQIDPTRFTHGETHDAKE